LTADSASTPEDTPIEIDVLANDVAEIGVTLSVASVDPPSRGDAQILSNGRILFTPEADFAGEVVFEYEAESSDGRNARATVHVEVLAVNDPPRPVDDLVTTNEDTPIVFDPTQNDVDVEGGAVRLASVGDPTMGVAQILPSGLLEYTPNPDAYGTDSFEYIAVDSEGAEAAGTITVEILPIDDPPQAFDDAFTLDEDTETTLDVLANDVDPDGDTLTVIAITSPTRGTAEILSDSRIRYLPELNFFGVDSLTYTLRDPSGNEASARVDLEILPVNDVPELDVTVFPPEGVLSRGGNVEVELVASDPDDPVKVDLLADRDGDRETIDDQTDLVSGIEPGEGEAVRRIVPTLGVDSGPFHIGGRVSDGFHPPVTTIAPGILESENVAWAVSAGSAREESIHAVASLPAGGGSFAAGVARGTIRVGEDLVVGGRVDDSPDALIVRYDANGAATTAWRGGGAGHDEALAIDAFADGSFVVCGFFTGSARFVGGDAEIELAAVDGSRDLFVAKHDRSGKLLWARRGGGADLDEARAIAALPDGSAIVAAVVRGQATLESDGAEVSVRARGGADIAIIRYGPAGSILDVSLHGGTGDDEARGLSVHGDGSFAVAGYFESDQAIFGEDERSVTIERASAERDLFVAKLDANGALRWVRTAGDERAVPGHSVTAHAVAILSDGSVAATGAFAGGATFGVDAPFGDHVRVASRNASLDIFVALFEKDGAIAWVRTAGGSASGDEGLGIAALGDGSVAVCGSVLGEATFGSSDAHEATLGSGSLPAAFVARWDRGGQLLWARATAGLGASVARAIAGSVDGSTIFGGRFTSSVVFGAGDERETRLDATFGDRDAGDAFVARLNADGGF
ncbi:MAG TPA: tandem-95 repeat protein, partial [Planctomycetota bacterium]|nr:tandem-95 repeat protein [Planctomycetota bacterium]